jgi:hypothetical protein
MARTIPSVSIADSVAFNISQIVPFYLRGIFTKNKFWISFLNKVQSDPLGVNFVRRLRRKYKSAYFYIYLLKTKALVVRDVDSIRHVLDHSPMPYAADPDLKRRGCRTSSQTRVDHFTRCWWEDRRDSTRRCWRLISAFIRARINSSERLTRRRAS